MEGAAAVAKIMGDGAQYRWIGGLPWLAFWVLGTESLAGGLPWLEFWVI